jgi:rubrerythrin
MIVKLVKLVDKCASPPYLLIINSLIIGDILSTASQPFQGALGAAAISPANLKARKNWTLNDIPWDQFDANKVNPEILKIIKAASLVEYNAHDYADYLCNVFEGDAAFQFDARAWAIEEIQHGAALGRWAEMADPTFNFEQSFKQFVAGYKIPTDAKQSVRGSHSGELIARCIVETGTSSFYTAFSDAVDEPVLKMICQCIAGDELRHYKLFYTYLKKYLEIEKLSPLKRLKIGLNRIQESEDDELAFAYYTANLNQLTGVMAANDNKAVPYNRERFCEEYTSRAYTNYKHAHMERVVSMVFKACGLNPQGLISKISSHMAWTLLTKRIHKAKKFVAKIA